MCTRRDEFLCRCKIQPACLTGAETQSCSPCLRLRRIRRHFTRTDSHFLLLRAHSRLLLDTRTLHLWLRLLCENHEMPTTCRVQLQNFFRVRPQSTPCQIQRIVWTHLQKHLHLQFSQGETLHRFRSNQLIMTTLSRFPLNPRQRTSTWSLALNPPKRFSTKQIRLMLQLGAPYSSTAIGGLETIKDSMLGPNKLCDRIFWERRENGKNVWEGP